MNPRQLPGRGPGTAPAASGPLNGLKISFRTAVCSISREKLLRWAGEPASLDACGPDEFITLCLELTGSSRISLSLRKPAVSIDGGAPLGWTDFAVQPGQTRLLHVYHTNASYLTPGLHTAVFRANGREISRGRFGIGRAWSREFRFPTPAQIRARPADARGPYLSGWLLAGDVRYDAYAVDFKSDFIAGGTYSAVFNGYLDYASARNGYISCDNAGTISLYGGLQRQRDGVSSNTILSFWDIRCMGANGKTTVIRPRQIRPEGRGASFGGEGEGAHTLIPFNWVAGRWYRMLLRCGTSVSTGNTTIEQWFLDLTTGTWTHACTYDIGLRAVRFKGNMCVFSENFIPGCAGGVRSLEITNVRIHTGTGWRDVTTMNSISSRTDRTGPIAGAYGSWEAGTDGNAFFMIATGVPGWGRTGPTGRLTVKNRESGDPLEGKPPQ